MTPQLLTRSTSRAPARPAVRFLDDLALAMGRVHEGCGNARRFWAALVAARTTGPVIWIAPSWQPERPNPDGLMRLCDPGRFLFLDPVRAEDLLWCMEEALRSGAAPLVIADLPAPPALTPVRRLHLAAEGDGEPAARPLGLILTPGQGGSPGVESRWHMGAAHGAPGRRAWRLDRLRARTAPVKSWRVTPQAQGFALAPETSESAAVPGGVSAD